MSMVVYLLKVSLSVLFMEFVVQCCGSIRENPADFY